MVAPDHLQGNVTLQAGIPGAEHLAHTALGHKTLHPVTTNHITGQQGYGRFGVHWSGPSMRLTGAYPQQGRPTFLFVKGGEMQFTTCV